MLELIFLQNKLLRLLSKSPPSSIKLFHSACVTVASCWVQVVDEIRVSSDGFKGGRFITVLKGSPHYSEGRIAWDMRWGCLAGRDSFPGRFC